MPDPFSWNSRIRFVDTDASGRIHYSALFRHLEIAEDEFLRSLGFPYFDQRAGSLAFPRVHVEAQFTAGLVYDDQIRIEVTVERVGDTSYTLYFMVYRQDGEAAVARGRITAVCMDKRTQKASSLPEDLREALLAARS
jgi:YbgC/YbaW family acyl-CoA thioester hydrolase